MKTFEDLGLSTGLVSAVQVLGFEIPTPIQEKAIPVLLQGDQDVIALAQTGTGKTAAFGLPLLELVDDKNQITQGLVLAPTRELCLQITSDLENFSEGYKSLNIVAVYGGASIGEQIRRLKRGAQIVVATPGRLLDLLGKRALNLQTIRFIVLDEADEMLNMGFKDDIDEILASTPETKITWLFSATMPKEVRMIANAYMSSPLELSVGDRNMGNVNIEHEYVVVQESQKYDALKRLLDFHPDIFGLIFCRTRIDTQRIAEQLVKDGYNADSLHGDLNQAQRDKVMMKFRSRSVRILVATDVAARGIDVDNITHVIHMNIPDEMEFYTHRSGRTARAGKKGKSIALVNPRETGKIRQIEKTIKNPFIKIKVPTGAEVCQKQLLALMHRVKEVKVNETELAEFLPAVYEELKSLTKEELIRRFASIEFNRFLEYYRAAPDLNVRGESSGSERYSTGDRMFINLGKMDGLDRKAMMELVSDCGRVDQQQIGKVEIKGAYSFFEIPKEFSQAVIQGFKGVEVAGRKVRVEVTGQGEGGGRPRRSGKPEGIRSGARKGSFGRSPGNRTRRGY